MLTLPPTLVSKHASLVISLLKRSALHKLYMYMTKVHERFLFHFPVQLLTLTLFHLYLCSSNGFLLLLVGDSLTGFNRWLIARIELL